MIWIVFVVGILALLFAWRLGKQVLKSDTGTPKMQEVAEAIKIGAEAFLKRQYITIAIMTIILAIVIFGAYFAFGKFGLG